jgi:hypothetical protein
LPVRCVSQLRYQAILLQGGFRGLVAELLQGEFYDNWKTVVEEANKLT